MDAKDRQLVVDALELIRNCIYHNTIGKSDHNYGDIKELEIKTDELKYRRSEHGES